MLHLYQSNRLEELAEMMLVLQRVQPLSQALAPEQIIVQSQGMRRYINRFLAQKQGIAANLQFHLPAGLSWRLMREHIGGIPELSPFSTEVMRWRLLALFQSADFGNDAAFQAAHTVLGSHLQQGSLAAYELAGQLADVFDQYLVYRPDWIEAWSAGKTVKELAEHDAQAQTWQATLWRFLDNGIYPVPHRVQLWQTLMHKLAAPQVQLPERYFVFGIATMAPMYLHLLKQLAEHSEVHILALNPSAQFWGDVVEPAQMLRDGGEIDLGRQGHPLLASLGKQGRDFFNDLTETEIHNDFNSFGEQPLSGSLLHSLQWHLQTQTLPETARREGWTESHAAYLHEQVFPRNPQRETVFQAALTAANPITAQLLADDSIQIHVAHSPLRELQILKERLLQLLERHPDLQPHDIAVLTPNIEPYAPFIEAVFGRHSPFGQALPYSIADVKRSHRQPFLHGLAQVLTLLGGRFESDKLLPLLDNHLITQHFGINRDDLPLLRETVAQLNIHWGADRAQRAEHGSDDKLFTWQQGLERLAAGWMLPENNRLWQNISPHAVHPDHIAATARFAALVQLLADTRAQWQQAADVPQWCMRLRNLCEQLFATDAENTAAKQQFEQALAQWQQQADLADFRLPLDFTAAAAHIGRFLEGSSEAGFLRGGITFCGMVPMRSLPFAALCLIGLNDGDFPRNTASSTFDLISRHPRKGDRARRDDDRYLFLEAILSARQYLHLSYIGKDIRTDEERAPSVLLNELADTVAAMSGTPAKELTEQWFVRHPLQAFSERYFSGSPMLQSSRQDHAQALNQNQTAAPFLNGKQPENPTPHTPTAIEQRDFIRFWRNPVRVWLQDTLNWQPPYTENGFDAAEPFAANQTRQLDNAYVQARRNHRDFDELAAELSAQSLLPAGLLGRFTAEKCAAAAKQLDAALLNSPTLPPQSGTLNLVSGSLNYRLNHLTDAGQLLFAERFLGEHNQNGRLNATDKIELLLCHLIACAAVGPVPTHFVSLYQSTVLPPLRQQEAADILAQWLTACHQGRQHPLPFFPRVNYAAALALCKPSKNGGADDRIRAEEAAADKYHKGYNGFAQEDYPEVQLVFGDQDEPPYRSDLFFNLTENLLLPLKAQIMALESESMAE